MSALLRHLEPMPLCDWNLRSISGRSIRGRYVDAFLLVENETAILSARRRVLDACAEAARTGARLVVLGGFSSIVGERTRIDLDSEPGAKFTTGNSLTAAVVAEQVGRVAEGRRVTVVGAGGDVGTGVCRVLAAQGYDLWLVGRDHRPLVSLLVEIPTAEATSWEEAAPRSDVVVLLASAPKGGISLDGVPRGAIVLDAGHPANASAGVGLRYARAGRVLHAHAPESDLVPVLGHAGRPGESHACLAEGVVLAYEGRWEAYSAGRGRITPERASEILALAARHGITSAPLHFEPPAP